MQPDRFVVYGRENPVFIERVIARTRWRWLAELKAWFFEMMAPSTSLPSTRIEEIEEVVN